MRRARERGNILATSLFALFLLMIFSTLLVDVGMGYAARQALKAPVEAASLAAARRLPDDPAKARGEAIRFLLYNGFRGDIKIGAALDPAVYAAATPDTPTKILNALTASSPPSFDARYYVEWPITQFSQADLQTLVGADFLADFPYATLADSIGLTADAADTEAHAQAVVVTPFRSTRTDSLAVDQDAAVLVAAAQKSLNAFGVFVGTPYRDIGAGAVAIGPNSAAPVTPKFTLATFGHLHGTPSIYNDILYIGEATAASTANRLLAINPKNGKLYWSFRASSSASTGDGISEDATLNRYRLDQDPNEQLAYETVVYATWGHGTGPHGIQTSPIGLSDVNGVGLVVFESTNGYVYALRADTGTPVWQRKIGHGQENALWTNASPTAWKDAIYIGSLDGSMYVLDRDDGSIIDTYQVGSTTYGGSSANSILSQPFVAYVPEAGTAVIFFGANNGKFYAMKLDASNGSITDTWWTYDAATIDGTSTNSIGSSSSAGVYDPATPSAAFMGKIRASYDRQNGRFVLYTGSDNNYLYAFDADGDADGNGTANDPVLWKWSTGRNPTLYRQFHNAPTIEVLYDDAGNETRIVHVGCSSGFAYALREASDGRSVTTLWTSRPFDEIVRIEATPTVKNGIVYYGARWRSSGIPTDAGDASGTKDGLFYGLDATDGSILYSYPIGNDTHSSLIYDDGYIYYAACDNDLHGDQVNQEARGGLFGAFLVQ